MELKKNISYADARDLLLEQVQPLKKENVVLSEAGLRILGEDIAASENIPSFDKSPYDGYALRAADTKGVSKENPVTLKIVEEVPAGCVATKSVGEKEAVKILTGAPIPAGADAVVPFEDTEFTPETVTIFVECSSGENVIFAGEDIRKGEVLATEGTPMDEAVCGMLAALGIATPTVYKQPLIGLLSTGRELVEIGESVDTGLEKASQETLDQLSVAALSTSGQIFNSNRHMLTAALTRLGFRVKYLGSASDKTDVIAERFAEGFKDCDAVISTGGVSVGDYDLTPQAMMQAGAKILIQKVKLKPGMACAYGMKEEIPVFGLSGNPISALTNFYAVVLPVLRKLAGYADPCLAEFDVIMKNDFPKKSKGGRLLRGKLHLEDVVAYMEFSPSQGNIVMSSAVGMNMMAIVPEGSGPIAKGTKLKGFMI